MAASLDGFIARKDGSVGWLETSDEYAYGDVMDPGLVETKAFTVAQNQGARLQDFLTVNLDMEAHYRPGENVVRRPAAVGGRGYTLVGRHEIMLPLLAQAVVERFAKPCAECSSSHPTRDA